MSPILKERTIVFVIKYCNIATYQVLIIVHVRQTLPHIFVHNKIFILCNLPVGLTVYLGDKNVTDWFIKAKANEIYTEYTDCIITKTNTTRIGVTFRSGKNT